MRFANRLEHRSEAIGLLIAALALLAVGCRGMTGADDPASTTPDQVPPDQTPPAVPVLVGYASIPTDPFELNSAAITGHVLTLEVSYGGGCRDHAFALLTSDTFQADSRPVQLGINLFHNANGDPCEAWLTEQLRFDLMPIKELYRTVYGEDSGAVILRLAHAPELVYRF